MYCQSYVFLLYSTGNAIAKSVYLACASCVHRVIEPLFVGNCDAGLSVMPHTRVF